MEKGVEEVLLQPEAVDRWCQAHLASRLDEVLFVAGHLSTVLGIRLTSGRQVVVKVRRFADRLGGCAAVHRQLFERGFPCPEPLVALEAMDDVVASAETMVQGGALLPSTGRSPAPFAQALAGLVDLAPAPSEIPALNPSPAWTWPHLNLAPLWPTPDDLDVDLNSIGGPPWLDHAGGMARHRLLKSKMPLVVGHGDWYTGNLRWLGNKLQAVFDWDGAVALPEPAVAGLAAAVYPTSEAGTEATIDESADFLTAYEAARERVFSPVERQIAWAAGLWNRSFDAKKQIATDGEPRSLQKEEALQREGMAGGSEM